MSKSAGENEQFDWLEAELADTIDEDYELELSEPALSEEIRRIDRTSHSPTIPRMEYFRALLALLAELIKLQDWVVTDCAPVRSPASQPGGHSSAAGSYTFGRGRGAIVD
jgi:hypothetical protein